MDKMESIIKYGKKAHTDGLVIGAGGNISERDDDFLIIKKKGADMSEGCEDSYVRLLFDEVSKRMADPAYEKEEADILSSETPLHIACYKVSPDIGAVIHVHPPYTIAASGKVAFLEDISYEFECILGKSVPVIDYIEPGSQDLASAVAEKVTEGARAVMLKKHGSIAVGKNLEEAYIRILALERACITYLNI
jgi:L-fuculose-phosphate aldolase